MNISRRAVFVHVVHLCFALLLVPALCTAAAHAPAPLLPMKDFFRNFETTRFAISPDGTKLAFMKPWQQRMNIFVRDLSTGKETQVTHESVDSITGYLWKGSDTILFFKDSGGDENDHLWRVSVASGNALDLTPFPAVKAALTDDLKDDPDHILLELNKRDPRVFDVYRCNVKTGQLDPAAENPGDVVDWLSDHKGNIRVAVRSDGLTSELLYRQDESKPFEKLLSADFKNTLTPLMFSYDNKNIYMLTTLGTSDGKEHDTAALYVYDPEQRRFGAELFSHPDVDVSGLLASRKRKTITAAEYYTDKGHLHFFTAEDKQLYDRLKALLPDMEILVTGYDDAENNLILRTMNDRTPGAYYLYEKRTDHLQKLADVAPWIAPGQMAAMQPVTFTSRDNLTIHGYLTLPVGVPARNLPLIVLPHGGPQARDVWGFDREVQFLANRGAAVLQVNYRGSTGYGKRFTQAGFKQWGRKMQDDLTDGVRWLIAQGIADPKRVAIYGGSYGGYAALAGLAFTPDLYACGVSYVGPSNLFTLLETLPPYWEPERLREYEVIGDPEKDKDLLTAVSPIFHADNIKAPLFVAQGANDPRVNKAESEQIVAAVRRLGKDVVYMLKDNEGHGFQKEENRFDFYREMEAFFGKHLGLATEAGH